MLPRRCIQPPCMNIEVSTRMQAPRVAGRRTPSGAHLKAGPGRCRVEQVRRGSARARRRTTRAPARLPNPCSSTQATKLARSTRKWRTGSRNEGCHRGSGTCAHCNEGAGPQVRSHCLARWRGRKAAARSTSMTANLWPGTVGAALTHSSRVAVTSTSGKTTTAGARHVALVDDPLVDRTRRVADDSGKGGHNEWWQSSCYGLSNRRSWLGSPCLLNRVCSSNRNSRAVIQTIDIQSGRVRTRFLMRG